ncbi:hypothetical protein FDO65_19465 [Nakamurella flava]|uniref:Uncharacterized protein n=1 Tax=Nakamurella flava TaxID=2576308 RepID=A0A4U6QAQ0_9ACTN|nr:hypothetical protein [Nakamurella flava]TKV56998.1 hypothetical protein FDO65_19465 [Nakamurella flava]
MTEISSAIVDEVAIQVPRPERSPTGPQRRSLRSRVKAVVDTADPVGLLEMGCPTDEYDNEIDDFVEMLGRTDSLTPLTAGDVIAVWEKWFYPGVAGTDPAEADDLARQLNVVRYA